jgi:ATP-dependent exoDNAse (exonuclease V) beta subunit
LGELAEAAGVDLNKIVDQCGSEVIFTTQSGNAIRGWTMNPASVTLKIPLERKEEPSSAQEKAPIYMPLEVTREKDLDVDEDEIGRNWRVTARSSTIPPEVVGKMVHKAIELWQFPGHPGLDTLLETQTLDAGLVSRPQRDAVISQVKCLLSRFQSHPLYTEIDQADEVYHEVPYSRLVGDHTENGYIDLLYRNSAGWQIVDFKTDQVWTEEHRNDLVRKYSIQLQRYSEVVESQLMKPVTAKFCFLDVKDRVEVVELK